MTLARRSLRAVATMIVIVLCASIALPPPAAGDTSGTVYLTTVPAIGGVHLSVGGIATTTASDGTASVQVANLNSIASQVRLARHRLDHGVRVSISRLVPGPHVARQSHLSVGLDVSSLVQLGIDSGATGVSATSISRVVLHSIVGDKVSVDPRVTDTVRLLSRRTRLVHGTLTAQPVTWSVDLVSVAPGVALTTDTPRFDPFGHDAWRLHLKTVNGTVVINTVPSTAGVEFQLEGATVTTGPSGIATAPVSDLNNLSNRLRLETPNAGGVQVTSLRISKLPPRRLHERRLVAALDVRRLVSLKFTDMNGLPVAGENITAMHMSVGNDSVELVGRELGEPTLLLEKVATRIGQSWQVRPVSYVLRSVRIDGGEAVFNGRQHFSATTGETWTVQLAVFKLTVTAHDAIFGSQVQSHALITKPDGSHYQLQLHNSRPSAIPAMVRGFYGLQIDSAVIGGHTNLLVSRDDNIDLRVVTLLDAVLMTVVAFFLLIGAVVGGRMMAQRRGAATRKGRGRQ